MFWLGAKTIAVILLSRNSVMSTAEDPIPIIDGLDHQGDQSNPNVPTDTGGEQVDERTPIRRDDGDDDAGYEVKLSAMPSPDEEFGF
jgi:hypothetical protein